MPPSPTSQRHAGTSSTTDLALISFFAALMAVCALIPAIHVGGLPVPITLQTFAVLLAGTVLGAKRAFLAAALYLVVGFAGLPVFADAAGGPAVFAKPSVGYLLAFPLAAALAGFIVERLPREKIAVSTPLIFAAALFSSFVLIHPLGIAGMAWRIPTDLGTAFKIDLTFWIGDVIKCVCVAIVATSVHRAFPALLAKRR